MQQNNNLMSWDGIDLRNFRILNDLDIVVISFLHVDQSIPFRFVYLSKVCDDIITEIIIL